MKKIFLAVMLFPYLCGCAQITRANEENQRQELVLHECKEIAASLNKDKKWLDGCTSGNALLLSEGKIENRELNYNKRPPDVLCSIAMIYFNQDDGEAAERIAKERKINCNKIISETAKKYYSQTSVDNVCVPWYNRNLHPVVLSEIDKIVAGRKLDCVQVVSSINQTSAIKSAIDQQAETLRAEMEKNRRDESLSNSLQQIQNNMARQQQNAMQQQIIMNSGGGTTRTTCKAYGSSFSCISN